MQIEQSLAMQLPEAYAGRVATAAAPSSGGMSFQQTLQAVQAPADMEAIFARAAQATGVPMNLLKAVAKAESDFNPNCVSHAGAMGVMQLMPENVKTLGVSDPFNAEQNIMGGAWHLRHMLDRYDGDVVLGLAAYNAGPGNVNKYGGVPPFKETQNYVRKVTQYAGQNLTIPASALTQATSSPRATDVTGMLSGSELGELTALLEQLTSLQGSLQGGLQSVGGEGLTQENASKLCDAMRMAMQSRLISALASTEDDALGDAGIPDLIQPGLWG